MRSTSASGVGTHTTSLPVWPTCGTYSFDSAGAAWANAPAVTSANESASARRAAGITGFNAVALGECGSLRARQPPRAGERVYGAPDHGRNARPRVVTRASGAPDRASGA